MGHMSQWQGRSTNVGLHAKAYWTIEPIDCHFHAVCHSWIVSAPGLQSLSLNLSFITRLTIAVEPMRRA